MMSEIRRLGTAEIDEMLAMSQFAFQYEIAPNELDEARGRARPEEYFGSFIDGKLAAKVGVLPLESYVNGKVVPMGGVCGVATWPEYRRGGLVAELLRHALEVMRADGQLVSYLAPFSFAFYRRYGYEHVIDRMQYTLERADWPTYAATGGSVRRTTDFADVAELYEAYASRFTGTLRRSDAWWQDRVKRAKPGSIAVYRNRDDVPTGYVIYRVKSSELTVYEMVFLDEDARRGLWGFLRNHDSMATKVVLIVPVDDDLPFQSPNPRFTQEVTPYFMCRIVDVQAFLRQYAFAPEVGGQALTVQVSDADASWNQAVFTITPAAHEGGDNAVRVHPGDATVDVADERCVACDVQTLTAMLFDYKRPTALARMGRLAGQAMAIAAWERAVPSQTPFLYDFF